MALGSFHFLFHYPHITPIFCLLNGDYKATDPGSRLRGRDWEFRGDGLGFWCSGSTGAGFRVQKGQVF